MSHTSVVELARAAEDYVAQYLKASGPVTRGSIANYLIEQQPGIKSSNAQAVADLAVRTMVAAGLVSDNGDTSYDWNYEYQPERFE
jgi:hypothetical protein